MTHPKPATNDARIDRYLDHEMTHSERADFERDLAADPDLAALVRALEGIDGSVRTNAEALAHIDTLAPAVAHDALPRRETTRHHGGIARSRRRAIIPFAALAAVLAIAVFAQLRWPAAPSPDQFLLDVSAAELYASSVQTFQPEVVCDTPEKLRQYALDAFGLALAADFDAGVTFVGWNSPFRPYNPAASPDAPRVLLALGPDETEIVVVFSRPGTWSPGEVGPGLTVHRSRIGALEVHEISPSTSSLVAPLLLVE